MARVFVSHASDDVSFAREVAELLAARGHGVFLDQSPDTGLRVGDDWERQLEQELRRADAAVFLVTPAFVESPWCTAEVATAKAQGKRLVPVAVDADPTSVPMLRAIQYVAWDAEPAAAITEIDAVLRAVDLGGALGWQDDMSPFPGLLPFDRDRSWAFAGRDQDLARLAERLRVDARGTEAHATAVVGSSGCGKSSLVRAGLAPLMSREPGWWVLPVVERPGTDPVRELARVLVKTGHQVGLGWPVDAMANRLTADGAGFSDVVEEIRLALPGPARRDLLLVVDQFEEVFTRPGARERDRFAACLRAAAGCRVHVVAALRSEFVASLQASPELRSIEFHSFLLRVLDEATLPAVITEPAKRAGIHVPDELVRTLVADTRGGQSLPLLAFTLECIGRNVRRGGSLATSDYLAVDGVVGALSGQAAHALDDRLGSGRSRREVLSSLLRLVTVDEAGRPTRRSVPLDGLPAPVRADFDAFVDRRLVTTYREDDRSFVSVAHEKFLTEWPPLAARVQAAASVLSNRRALEQAAADWDVAGRPDSHLWPRGRVLSALPERSDPDGTDSLDLNLPEPAVSFARTSVRRHRLTRVRATTVLAGLLALALAAAGWATVSARNSAHQRDVATAENLLSRVELERDRDPRLAMRLGLAAMALDPSPRASGSLVETLTNSRYLGGIDRDDGARLGEPLFAPSGRILATSRDDRTVLIDLADPRAPRTLSDGLEGVPVSFNRDATVLTTSKDDQTALWDVTDPAAAVRIALPDLGLVSDVSPDGSLAAVVTEDEVVSLWDVTDPSHPVRRRGTVAGSWGTFDPIGRLLVVSAPTSVEVSDGPATLWRVDDPDRPRFVADLPTDQATFSPDGTVLGVQSKAGRTANLWQVGPTGELTPYADELADSVLAGFSPDGALAVTRQISYPPSGGEFVRIWDVASYPKVHGYADVPASDVFGFSADATTLVTDSPGVDGGVDLWDVRQLGKPTKIGVSFPTDTGTVSADGKLLATGNPAGGLSFWDLSNPYQPVTVAGDGPVLTDDGTKLAVLDDGQVALFDVSDPRQPRPVGRFEGGEGRLVFSDDGRYLALASEPAGTDAGSIMIWDVGDPAHPRPIAHPLPGSALRFVPQTAAVITISPPEDWSDATWWDISDLSAPTRVGSDFPMNDIAFDDSGQLMITGRYDFAQADAPLVTTVLDVSDPAVPRQVGESVVADAFAFSPTLRLLAAVTTGRPARLFQVTDSDVTELETTLPPSHGAGFPVDGPLIMISTEQGVELYDLSRPARPELLRRLFVDDLLVLSEEGELVYTVSGTDGAAGTVQQTIDPDRARPVGQAIPASSGDGDGPGVSVIVDQALVTVGEPGRTTLWDLGWIARLGDDPVGAACYRLADEGLDRDGWAEHAAGTSYRSTCGG